MAEHYAEGLLTRLLGLDKNGDTDKGVQNILQQYTFYIVPCMCPDGAVMGHLRTNSVGANLNREWATVKSNYEAPTLERSPEVYCVLQKMDETGVGTYTNLQYFTRATMDLSHALSLVGPSLSYINFFIHLYSASVWGAKYYYDYY